MPQVRTSGGPVSSAPTLLALLLCSAVLVCVTVACASSQDTCSVAAAPVQRSQRSNEHAILSEADAREDLEQLYRSLRSAHYDLYAYRPKAEYDAYFAALKRELVGRQSRLDLIRKFQPFVAFGRIGHARIEYPVVEYMQAADRGDLIVPFDIRLQDGRVLIHHTYGKTEGLSPGSEIVSIDGQPVDDLVSEIARFVSGERAYMINAQLEAFFPRWLWLARGSLASVRVQLRIPDGGTKTIVVRGGSIGEIESAKSRWTEALRPRSYKILNEDVAYLRPGPFYGVDGDEPMNTERFRVFIDSAFAEFARAGVRDLLIDLRDNPGGDNSFSDLMIAHIADRPFRFSHDFKIRVSPELRSHFDQVLADGTDEDGVLRQMQHAMAEHGSGARVSIELPLVDPVSPQFSGRVFVLVNRHCYSNGASVAGLLQDYGFATIIGEETADLPTSYAASATFKLRHSGISVTYPKGYFVRPSGDASLRGVVPDIVLGKDVWTLDHELVLRAALAAIPEPRCRSLKPSECGG